jgi:hypothetical protein
LLRKFCGNEAENPFPDIQVCRKCRNPNRPLAARLLNREDAVLTAVFHAIGPIREMYCPQKCWNYDLAAGNASG